MKKTHHKVPVQQFTSLPEEHLFIYLFRHNRYIYIYIYILNSITVKKCEISNTFVTQMTYIIWKLAKTTYNTFKRLPGIFKFFLSYEL
jgi:hypothetical protein